MKSIARTLTALLLAVLLAAPVMTASADDAGVLSEGELNVWIRQVLQDSAKETPVNAPVGEDALTEDGYAFIYSFATLYYNKPALDADSVLKAVALTDPGYASPRGIKIGDDVSVLINSFGWQNPMLLGSDTFAAFYVRNQLPEAAYWSWAQRENDAISVVQCAIHAKSGPNRYTDAGLRYAVADGKLTGFGVYGLDAVISESDVRRNVNAVLSVEAAITGDEHSSEETAEGYYEQSAAAPFGANDLLFGGVNYMTLDETAAQKLFGAALKEEKVKDDTGAWLVTTRREGLTLSYTVSADGAASVLDSLSVSGELKGPRGIQNGMAMGEVLKLFYSDGAGTVLGSVSVLYGDGENAPTGLLEQGEAVRYRADIVTTTGRLAVTLRMTFVNGLMTEWMVYSW